ncbi:sensor histidine kinase [uncultured Amnibacterium sp.]|uniref:sensor histidine kinase n=1 Tax=uncultured Amnibacterium sp. TaxID=1631851 RepID=UPI0035CB1288
MQLPPSVRAVLTDARLRLGFAVFVAVCWYILSIAGEAGRNWIPIAFAGIPSVLVLIWWRTRPWVAIACSVFVLFLLFVFTFVLATSANGGAISVGATAWFAVLGAWLTADQRLRWGGALLVLVYCFLTLGGAGTGAFIAVAFFGVLAIGFGWGWQQLRRSEILQGRLVETAQQATAAERDVLLELERNRIAREVHDVVAHSLAVVIAQADGARFAAETKPASVGPALEAISDTARRALGEVRTMLHDLRTSGEAGVIPGPEDLAGLVAGIRALDVEVDEATFGEARPLDERSGLALYRIAQEALTNAMRHGDRAEPVGFELDWGEREVVLVVTNAVPADGVAATERAGHGIPGMRERAADADGDCSAGVGSNGRFRVRVALPIPREPEPEPEPEAAANPLAALLAAAAEPRA